MVSTKGHGRVASVCFLSGLDSTIGRRSDDEDNEDDARPGHCVPPSGNKGCLGSSLHFNICTQVDTDRHVPIHARQVDQPLQPPVRCISRARFALVCPPPALVEACPHCLHVSFLRRHGVAHSCEAVCFLCFLFCSLISSSLICNTRDQARPRTKGKGGKR